MQCPRCDREIALDRLFCNWCEAYVPDPRLGKAAGIFRRWVAAAIDPVLLVGVWWIGSGILAAVVGSVGLFAGMVAVAVLYAVLFSRGTTLGKLVLQEQVVTRNTGNAPGFLRMLVRETVGKGLSGLPFGLGFLWALWDPNKQAWHDKLVGTVVVHRAGHQAPEATNAQPVHP